MAEPRAESAAEPGQPADDPRRWVALVVCCSALFMTLLDVSVTNVALPSIGNATGAGPSELQWVGQRLHARVRPGAGARRPAG